MLPANLAKTRAAGRGAYGELVMLNPAGTGAAAAAAAAVTSALRYAPYPLPATVTGLPVHHHHHHGPAAAATGIPVAAIAVAPAPLHYATAYDVTGCKRVFAAPAAATLRPLAAAAAAAGRAPPTLTYSMSDLLGVQGLEIPATVYANTLHAGLGL